MGLWEQLGITGMKALKGASRIEGKPGMWWVNPAELSESKLFDSAIKKLAAEGNLARAPGGVPSISGKSRARAADMTQGALETLRLAGNKLAPNPSARGVVYVAPSGETRGAASFDIDKAAEYLSDPMDLDMTAKFPTYLDYVGRTSPETSGRELLRAGQSKLGPEMVFQVAAPKENAAIYEAMGAKRMAPLMDGTDPLGGRESLPAFEIKNWIETAAPRRQDLRQLELPLQQAERPSTIDVMRQSMDMVGEKEFQKRVDDHIFDLGDELSPEEYAAEVEGVARRIVEGAYGDPMPFARGGLARAFAGGGNKGKPWSFRDASMAQRKEDDAQEAAIRGHMPSTTGMTEWSGKRGTSLADWAGKNLPASTWGKQAQEQVGAEALLGAITPGMVAKPVMMSGLGALALGSNEAQASKLGDLISAGRRVFVPSHDPKQVYKAARSALEALRGIDDGLREPLTLQQIERAMAGGSNLFGIRAGITPEYFQWSPITQRSPKAQTPGQHAAPLERPGQVRQIHKVYESGGEPSQFDIVHQRVETPIVVGDTWVEYPEVLASKVGALDDLRAFSSGSSFDPTKKSEQQSEFITNWLANRGIDIGIYDNAVEGLRHKKPSANFPVDEHGGGDWNPSFTSFRNLQGLRGQK